MPDNSDMIPTMTDTEQVQEPPAFTAEYWTKAPRKLMPAAVVLKASTLPNGNKEYVLNNGARIERPAGDVKQLIFPGTTVEVQIIRTGGGQIVTGLFVPDVKGWAWQMTAQELADYAREVNAAVVDQRVKMHLAMVSHLKGTFVPVLSKYIEADTVDAIAEELAVEALIALEEGPA